MTAVSEERKQGPRCPHGRVDQHHDRDPVEVKSSEARAPGRVGVVGGESLEREETYSIPMADSC